MQLARNDSKLTRRRFLAGTAATVGGLTIAIDLPLLAKGAAAATPTASRVTAWVSIGTDESVTILVGASEMGQGVLSGLPQILAEELMVDWQRVKTAEAPPAAAYVNPASGIQLTGGSMSVRGYFDAMLVAGATARVMLIEAAAARLGVPVSTCTAAHGVVTASGIGKSLTYGAVAADAANLTPPTNPPLLSKSRGYQLVGKAVPRPDIPGKVNGGARFGIDARVPGMVYAAIKHCPTLGGTVGSVPAAPAGTLGVVSLGNAVAVVAADTWTAIRAARGLKVTWVLPKSTSGLDSSAIGTAAKTLMATGKPVVAETIGNPDAAIAAAARVLTLTYSLPYVPHACMEPLNCTVSVTATKCELWVPTQAPGFVAGVAAAITGLPISAITVNSMLMGGGLGRKFETDYVAQAVTVAKAIGKPVKLTWSREEDFSNDQYRPMALARVAAGLDASGQVVGWVNRIVSPSILGQRGWIRPNDVDGQAVDGAVQLPYAFKTRRVEYVRHPAAIPVGFWRSVGHSINAFVVESAVDELALAAGSNPLAFRRRLLAGNTRGLAVLNAAAQLGGWGTALPAGHARGIAYHESFGSIAAQVVEVALVSAPGAASPKVRVAKVSAAVDCGLAVNPNSVEAQIHSGIVHGLNAAQWGQMRFDNGVPQTRNFDDYPMMRLHDMPAIQVAVLASPGAPLGGIGEVGVPCAAPALANAYAALTGIRKRDLPLQISTATRGDN